MSIFSAYASVISTHRTRIQLAIGVILLAATLLRLGSLFQNTIFIDYLAYCDTTQAIMGGRNPYVLQNLRYHDWGEVPIVYPGYVLFFQLIAKNPQQFQITYLLLSIIFLFGTLTLLLTKTCLRNEIQPLRQAHGFLIYSLVIFAFFNASPTLATLRQGQTTSIIFFCLFMMLIGPRQFPRYLLFGTAAIMKYSLLTIWAPLLFFKKYYTLCLIAFLFFIGAGLYCVVYYPDIIALIAAYLHELTQSTSGGLNTYSVSGYNMLHLDFIKSSGLAASLKIAFLIGGIGLFLKERKQQQISLYLLFSATCLTMLISYHRVYDVIILLPFLSLFCYEFLVTRKYRLLAICLVFQVYFLIPESMVFKISDLLGMHVIFLEQWLHLSHYEEWHHLLPTHAIVMLLMTGFAYYLNLAHTGLYCFDLVGSGIKCAATAPHDEHSNFHATPVG
ncbi:hypothetical protein [uncultured Thiodictyon sp.]|uniref:hypothetical protein n=1 Tax=uncultured Thiodictyon sp. TaxID=1846217 RepID=UPI0025F4D950|nr:hypothetical protein [uncultured Thiodictyon sp.]